jgi:hypothetical protein
VDSPARDGRESGNVAARWIGPAHRLRHGSDRSGDTDGCGRFAGLADNAEHIHFAAAHDYHVYDSRVLFGDNDSCAAIGDRDSLGPDYNGHDDGHDHAPDDGESIVCDNGLSTNAAVDSYYQNRYCSTIGIRIANPNGNSRFNDFRVHNAKRCGADGSRENRPLYDAAGDVPRRRTGDSWGHQRQ